MIYTEIENTIWKYPLSMAAAMTFLLVVWGLWRFLPEGRVRQVLSGRGLCLTAIAGIVVMTAVEGSWGTRLHASPVFWAFALMLMLSLQFTIMEGIMRRRAMSFIASHAGIFLLSFGAFWGAADMVEGLMPVRKGAADNIVYCKDGRLVTLPFTVGLKEFRTDYYEDGSSPKQYTSTLTIGDRKYETSVNHPCYHRGYFIYQYDFDHEQGQYSILKLVKDPWLPIVYAGIVLLALGAFLQMRMNWRSRYLTVAIVLVAILFAVLSIARINFGTLMPALRSWWFVPHLVLYMIAYSSLAISLLLAILAACGVRRERFGELSHRLFGTASSLLLLGMLCGAVWAKAAWGDWWTWDAKECWAAVTWLVTLMGIHLPHGMRHRQAAMILCIALSFAAMQIAWYGVSYLPAAKNSMHTYNRK